MSAPTLRRPPDAVPLRAALGEATALLAAAGVPSPRADAEQLAAFVLGCPRTHLLAAGVFPAGRHELFRQLVAKRAERIPLQHLTGSVGFRRLELAVGPGVFIPRPETEVLAEWVISRLHTLGSENAAEPLVVDLCTGSGALAIAIAAEVPGARVHAVDDDPAALAWAERNVAGTGARVFLHLADAAHALPELNGLVDVVVANPPYLAESQRALLDPEVADHDPPRALWSAEEGLAGPRMVIESARRLLRDGGWLAIEHGDDQGPAVRALLAAGWTDVEGHADLSGRARFVTARRVRGDGE